MTTNNEYGTITNGKLVIKGGVTIIKSFGFSNKSLTSVEIPNSVTIIGVHAFSDNNLTSVRIPNSVTKIGECAFLRNNLTSIFIPNSVTKIEELAFSDNNLTNIRIPSGVSIIGDSAFSKNNLISLEIPYGVIEIGKSAFSKNNLTSLKIPSSVAIIGDDAFARNNLSSITISDSVTIIGSEAFSKNNLISLMIPNSVTTIKSYAFSSNNLVSIKIPNSITKIENGVFFNNYLTKIEIPSSVTAIGSHAFADNILRKVEIPSSVIEIGDHAFDDIDIIYDGVMIDKSFIKKYGTENIIKIYNMSKIIKLEYIKNMSISVLDEIPYDTDSIKGYALNHKLYNEICESLEITEESEEAKDVFKMCHALGLFKNKIDKKTLFNIIKTYELDEVHQMWTSVKLKTYDDKFKELFIKLYKENNLDYKDRNIVSRLYNSFKEINDYTINVHKEIISKKNAEINALQKEGADVSVLVEKLNTLKKKIRTITYEDICYYIENNTFDIKDGNEMLKSVVGELSIHIEQDEFNEIQDMYEESKNISKSIPFTKDKTEGVVTYHWSRSDNPTNLILGYLVNCCAKLGGAGEDIMRQSMINPNVCNLIIYDENNQVLGKATAYYNQSNKYILFNNAEFKVTKDLKNNKARRKELLEAILRAVNDVVKEFKEQGVNINEVRMGMKRNDLEEAIKEAKLEIELNNLFDNYPYKNYSGDANEDEGQVILYKDSDINKGKII